MSDPVSKPHYFELSLRSVSNGKLNQEIPLVREYADTPGELVFKNIKFAKAARDPVTKVVMDIMEQMAMPFYEQGAKEIAEAFESFGKVNAPGQNK